MARLLIVDDDAAFRETLAETLHSLGHEVLACASGAEGLEALQRNRCDAVFLDHRMPGMDGLQTLAAMRARLSRLPPVIVLTAFASGGNTIEAMRLGAFDHLAKPISRQAVIDVLARALRAETPAERAAPAASEAEDDATGLIGVSDAMREVHKRIGLAAASSAPVLVLGETGTGKEMVARALHRHSARAGAPFVAINCAAIPKDLLESELFGHVRGAFSGATADRPGCFRAADGGVLLLDEIGDMAPAVQAKILRVLQEGEVTPLGSHRTVRVDVRVIAATHRDLAAAVRDGRFREDLLYRLDVLTIRLPPLRERLADILPLAEHFLRRAAADDHDAPAKLLSNDAAQWLLRHPWPGNVRELRNLMARCQALVRHRVIGAEDLGPAMDQADRAQAGTALPADWLDGELPAAVERLERLLIAHALARSQGNRAEAARSLGIHRQLLYRKMAQYQLD
ncbi:sigma-54-dependent Fis family transcriptional regulator [Rhodoferax koreense]|uniref:Sigma-54-dependent Fis family transcriptional regulator n=1 Tax=Rhodoferax koreensis TaxID=1842727 RepID=A0A1P8JW37_9BURK|nr:sigma-54 dependent transcriptional regulator [Rhodoferax koreense]APW37967.1 sigma-54-dependent Fis family transcriptional regulator [Rhodoferax koreense]